MLRLALALFALLFLAEAGPASAQDRESVDVAGLVADAGTGAPISGAVISLDGTRLQALTNEDGRFVLRGIPRGEHRWIIARLGYVTWEQALAVEHLDQLRIGLMPRPVALEAITVTVDRLEARRKLAPVGVYTATREVLRTSPATDAADLAESRMHWMPAGCPAGGGGAGSPGGQGGVPDESSLVDPASRQGMRIGLCIRSRGRIVQPRIYLDERPVPYALLLAYAADEIYEIDYFGGGATAEIRLYTRHFLESGRPIRPLGF